MHAILVSGHKPVVQIPQVQKVKWPEAVEQDSQND